jgi:arginine utilization protein RocB
MTSALPDLKSRTREIAYMLTSWPSVTGTADEALFAERLTRFLNELHGIEAWKEQIPHDHLGRSNVFALKRGAARKAIVLAGHFDTVPYDDYGPLKNFALDPARVTEALTAQLEGSGESPLALADFRSGEFVGGRGLLDMKAGIAAGITAMERSESGCSLLLIATPDEEDRSAGMRAAAPMLRRIAERYGLDIGLVINLDAISDQDDGAAGRVAALGSIGKLLLSAYVAGKPVHACYSQEGVNAAYVAAELASELELAPELAETTGGERAAAPTALSLKDLKKGYNVTTPSETFIYWNTLQHRRSGAEVLEIALRLARRALARVEARTGAEVKLMTVADVMQRAQSNSFRDAAYLITGRPELDLPDQARELNQLAWAQSGLVGPAVVLGFASVPYPAVSLMDTPLERLVRDCIQPFGIGAISFFPGISDMSFIGRGAGSLAAVEANTPHWGTSFSMQEPAGYPCINIGPWGRDYHSKLERLHAPYAFETLPKALLAVIEAVAASR